MEDLEILEGIKNNGMDFLYNSNITKEQLQKISKNLLYVILNNKLENEFYNEFESDII